VRAFDLIVINGEQTLRLSLKVLGELQYEGSLMGWLARLGAQAVNIDAMRSPILPCYDSQPDRQQDRQADRQFCLGFENYFSVRLPCMMALWPG
jgi:hypothetical protein